MASPIVTNTTAQLNGASLVYGFQTALTNAQLIALPTTPVSVVSAPGAGYRIKVIGATIAVDATAGAYTNVNTASASITLSHTNATSGYYLAAGPSNDSSLAVPLTGLTTFLGATATVADLLVPFPQPIGAGAQSGSAAGYVVPSPIVLYAATENLPVYVSLFNNGSGVLTGGNAANTGLVTVYYAVEALA